MITRQDLQEIILQYEAEPNPTRNTCLYLAAFYTLQKHLFPDAVNQNEIEYSSASEPSTMPISESAKYVTYSSGTDFGQRVNGRDADEIFKIIDELMGTLAAVNPRLYDAVMRKL